MRKTRSLPLAAAAALVLTGTASAGLFRGPYDFSLGPYRGGQGWSYNESYGYFGVASVSEYPYYALFPYTLYTPFGWGLRNTRGGYYGDGIYGMNPAYLIPPRAPGYTKESARDVVLPPMNQINGLAATIDIKMPCFGELWVDGVPTEQLGTDRLFRSPPLEKGGEYVYALRARWLDGSGKMVEQTQQVRVHCGDRVQVVFPKPAQP
ncbi:MAG TPA: TIGR03000 domain-containing protein [Gemmataceae bacterium]|jgi:uncharacterized protein (TIGR03000 family)